MNPEIQLRRDCLPNSCKATNYAEPTCQQWREKRQSS